jgi:hypothetical protein
MTRLRGSVLRGYIYADLIAVSTEQPTDDARCCAIKDHSPATVSQLGVEVRRGAWEPARVVV